MDGWWKPLKNNFMKSISNTIKTNIWLYQCWLAYQRNIKKSLLKLRLPQNTDDLYVDGYPRSGNTFCVGFINQVYPNLNHTHHLHTIAPLKMAIKFQLKIFIVYRNPLDAIASHMLMKSARSKKELDKNLAKELLTEYILYNSFVLKHMEKLTLIPFETIIDMDKLYSFLNENFKPITDVSLEDAKMFEIKYKEKQKEKPLEKNMAPSAQKQERKNQIYQLIQSHQELVIANQIFDNLNKNTQK